MSATAVEGDFVERRKNPSSSGITGRILTALIPLIQNKVLSEDEIARMKSAIL